MAQDAKNPKSRRVFDTSFKLQIVQIIKGPRPDSLAGLLGNMNLVQSAVRRWISQFEAEQDGLSGIGKPITAGRQGIRQPELENRQLRGDVEVLKKAWTLFARELRWATNFVEQLQKQDKTMAQPRVPSQMGSMSRKGNCWDNSVMERFFL